MNGEPLDRPKRILILLFGSFLFTCYLLGGWAMHRARVSSEQLPSSAERILGPLEAHR